MPRYVVEALVKTAVLIDADNPFRAQSRARAVLRGQGKDVDSITNVVEAREDADLQEGDPCPTCSEPLLWDRAERVIYCVNDWKHG